MRRLSRIKRATRKGRNPRLRLALRQCQACGKVINPSKSKEGVQREMGQTGIPHGVPLSGNGMSLATGGLWDLGCCYLFQPRPGEPPRVRTETVNGFKARDPSGRRSPPSS